MGCGTFYLIKAFTAGDSAIDDLEQYGAKAVLVDASEPGSGEVFRLVNADGRERETTILRTTPANVGRAAVSCCGVLTWLAESKCRPV